MWHLLILAVPLAVLAYGVPTLSTPKFKPTPEVEAHAAATPQESSEEASLLSQAECIALIAPDFLESLRIKRSRLQFKEKIKCLKKMGLGLSVDDLLTMDQLEELADPQTLDSLCQTGRITPHKFIEIMEARDRKISLSDYKQCKGKPLSLEDRSAFNGRIGVIP